MPQIILLMFLLISCLTACVNDRALEFRYVDNLDVSEIKSNSNISLKVSGFAMHSSLAVKKIDVTTEDNVATIIVYLTLARKDLTGNFDFEFSVPSNIDKVMFGPEKHLIWVRGQGPIK